MGRHRLDKELEGVSRILSEAEVDDMEFEPGITVLTVEQVEVSRRSLLASKVIDDTVELPQVQS